MKHQNTLIEVFNSNYQCVDILTYPEIKERYRIDEVQFILALETSTDLNGYKFKYSQPVLPRVLVMEHEEIVGEAQEEKSYPLDRLLFGVLSVALVILLTILSKPAQDESLELDPLITPPNAPDPADPIKGLRGPWVVPGLKLLTGFILGALFIYLGQEPVAAPLTISEFVQLNFISSTEIKPSVADILTPSSLAPSTTLFSQIKF